MDEILTIYRAELARVQAERDAANAETRRLWAAVALLRGAAEGARAGLMTAKVEAENEGYVNPESLGSIHDDATADIESAAKLLGMVAA